MYEHSNSLVVGFFNSDGSFEDEDVKKVVVVMVRKWSNQEYSVGYLHTDILSDSFVEERYTPKLKISFIERWILEKLNNGEYPSTEEQVFKLLTSGGYFNE